MEKKPPYKFWVLGSLFISALTLTTVIIQGKKQTPTTTPKGEYHYSLNTDKKWVEIPDFAPAKASRSPAGLSHVSKDFSSTSVKRKNIIFQKPIKITNDRLKKTILRFDLSEALKQKHVYFEFEIKEHNKNNYILEHPRLITQESPVYLKNIRLFLNGRPHTGSSPYSSVNTTVEVPGKILSFAPVIVSKNKIERIPASEEGKDHDKKPPKKELHKDSLGVFFETLQVIRPKS